MDAEHLLRRYLEQRRELGEREFVLDALSVEDALKLLGARPRARPDARPEEARLSRPSTSPPREATRAPERDSGDPSRTAAAEPDDGTDWRATLRAAASGAPKPTHAAPPPAPDHALGETNFLNALQATSTVSDVASLISQCQRCPLFRTALNHVPGEGNPKADFMCVGEAPGETEDETGRPFVGRAGQLLTKILGAINLSREEVFIANVLKHRPPRNRNPEPAEVKACRPYLVRQVELVQPRVILALGTFAAQSLLETTLPLGRLRGIVHTFAGVPVVVTYHPAALLRNPHWKRPAWEDVQHARRILDSASA